MRISDTDTWRPAVPIYIVVSLYQASSNTGKSHGDDESTTSAICTHACIRGINKQNVYISIYTHTPARLSVTVVQQPRADSRLGTDRYTVYNGPYGQIAVQKSRLTCQ